MPAPAFWGGFGGCPSTRLRGANPLAISGVCDADPLIARLDTKPTKGDWALYESELAAMLLQKPALC
ncbi:MAG: hypothetical protein J2P48_01565 [Alphaproteobacteria bacterium]|nr:hypothetical protein [Alphaproteobacteria bacterium]